MSSSVWPYDTFLEPEPPIDDKSIGSITCFIASPVEPKQRWDDLFALIQTVTAGVGKSMSVAIQCYRADHITSAGVIHPEIWKALRAADFIICDVSGQNGNVMLELGVAAAWRRKEHVIILRDRNDEKPRLFDINPARHLEYEISFSGFQKLMRDLSVVVANVLANIPFQTPPRRAVALPFRASLTDGKDAPELYTEDITHRRMLPDCLEFGAPLNYRYSWMSLGDLRLSKVHVKAEIKMTLDLPPTAELDPFMGVMVRGQHYFANFGHLIFVRKDGTVYLTVREDVRGKYHDEPVGKTANFDMRQFVYFDIAMDDDILKTNVNNLSVSKRLTELPYVFSAGRVIFIAGYCRVGVRNIEVEEL